MNSSLVIRYATPADNTLLAELGAHTFAAAFAADLVPESMRAYLAAAFNPAQQARELAEPTARFVISEHAGVAVGYAQLNFAGVSIPLVSRKPVEIVRLYVQRQWFGTGVGAQLMQTCLTEAERADCDLIWLGVWEHNPRAIAFYHKWGFRQVGAQSFQLGAERQTDLVMARPVASGG